MSRISAKFEELRRRGEGALIAFVMAGDPKPVMTPEIVKTLSKHADIIELGIAFSDPIADGPTIQAAADRALRAGTTPPHVFAMTKKIRQTNGIPIVVLTYYNLVLKPHLETFMQNLSTAGVDGIIIPDLPLEEIGEVRKVAKKHHVDLILLAAPTTQPKRMKQICEASDGFVYLVSLLGVTGAREKLSGAVKNMVAKAKIASKRRIPLAVGFGISKPEHVKEVIKCGADGAIVGSAFVKIIEKNLKNEQKMLRELENFGKILKSAAKTRRG
ncbi:MAG TPA: tryptophan synthase subunit alpha [Desulfobacterales bacterium]|nr:tryptophan synthase subunit alpha [Desulfobacterales bacterium]